ncbi:DUF3566 domain-containing protein [bacterium]
MNKSKLKSISVKSVLINLPLVYLILGFLVGIASYLYLKLNPAAVAPRIGFLEWLLAILLYGLIFCVVLSLISIVGAFVYNMLSKKFGGVSIELSSES